MRSATAMRRRAAIGKVRGFTLIELMIVVAVIALLSTLAITNYNRYGFRARRVEAKDMLMRLAAQEEQYHTNFNVYTKNLKADLKYASDTPNSENGYYTISADVPADGQSYTLKATPVTSAGQKNDKCNELQLLSTGEKKYTGAETNGKCW